MADQPTMKKPKAAETTVEHIKKLSLPDLNDLCDATDEAINAGGGFGWLKLPAREILERYWQGVVTMPARLLYVARLDGVICGTAQLILPPSNNEAQSFSVQLTTNFVSPWARKYGLARKLLDFAEKDAQKRGFSVINLDVRETQEAAVNLYESAGYMHIGTHPYYAQVDGEAIRGRYYFKVIDESFG